MGKTLLFSLLLVCVGCAGGQTNPEGIEAIKKQLSDLQRVLSQHSLQIEKINMRLHENESDKVSVEIQKNARDKFRKNIGLKSSTKKNPELWTDLKIFNRAFSLKEEDPKNSMDLFAKLVTIYERSPLADNALYWLGMIQFKSGNYPKAVVFWDWIIRDYPKSNKVAEALYQIGLGYQKLKQNEKAKLAYDQLFRDHGHSEAAEKAKGLL